MQKECVLSIQLLLVATTSACLSHTPTVGKFALEGYSMYVYMYVAEVCI